MTVLIVLFFIGGILLTKAIMSRVETTDYEFIQSDGAIEIRQYHPMIIARVQAKGTQKEVMSDGFKLLTDYIFGNNAVQQKIAMTSPVQQQELDPSLWEISFVMPSQYTMETLPQPNNKQVVLQKVLCKKKIVIQFSGKHSEENIKKHEKRFWDYIQEHNIPVKGSPCYAFYHQPWTLPSMRRNELMVDIAQTEIEEIEDRSQHFLLTRNAG